MKLKPILTLGLLALGTSAVSAQEVKLNLPGSNEQPAPSAPAAAPTPAAAAPAPAFSESQVLEVIGWFIGKNSQVETFDFTKQQLEAVWRGFLVAAESKEAPVDLQKIGPQVEELVKAKQEAYLAKLKQQGQADTAKFLAEIKAKPGVTTLPSGLAFEIINAGTDPKVKVSDTVKAHYTGTLINGTVFDTSREPRQPGEPVAPAEFAMDAVIQGWQEGLQKVGKGGKIKLYVPPHLAYGDDGRPGIPPASTLIFDVDVLEIKPTPGPASLGTAK